MSFIFKFSRALNNQMKANVDLYPLMGAYVGAGALAAFAITYSALSKADVSINRWTNPRPCDRIDPSRCSQKWVTAIKKDKDCYFYDAPIESLRKEVYVGFDASQPSVAH